MSSKKTELFSENQVLRRMMQVVGIEKYSVSGLGNAINEEFAKTPKQMTDALYQWPKGGYVPDTVIAFGHKHGVSVDWLLYGEGAEKRLPRRELIQGDIVHTLRHLADLLDGKQQLVVTLKQNEEPGS